MSSCASDGLVLFATDHAGTFCDAVHVKKKVSFITLCKALPELLLNRQLHLPSLVIHIFLQNYTTPLVQLDC